MTAKYHDGSIVTHTLPLVPAGETPPGTVLGPLRAIVLATYVFDDIANRSTNVECDVLPYAGGRPLYRVPVAGGGGPHQGSVWTPNPSGRSYVDVKDLSELEGDHVVVTFMGGRANDPVITGRLPHPRAAYRPRSPVTQLSNGRHPALADAPCMYLRHQGTVLLADRRGNVVVDTAAAPQTAAGAAAGGDEPAGNVYVQLQSASRLEVRVGNTVLLVVENGVVKLGANPTMHGTLFEALKTYLSTMTVPTAFGPSGNPPTLPDTCKSTGVLLDTP